MAAVYVGGPAKGDAYITYYQSCALCDKSLGQHISPRSLIAAPTYCADCKRAVRIAKMKAEGTLPDVG